MVNTAAHSSAGVYVTEVDQSQFIAAANTSIGAIVLRSAKGPVMERTLITSNKQFLEVFGKPDPEISLAHYSALTFLEKGSRLYVTRVCESAAPDAPLTAGAYFSVDDISSPNPIVRLTNFDAGPNSNQPLGKWDPFNTLTFDPNTPGIENILGFFCAMNPGEWNNQLFIRIRPSKKLGIDDPSQLHYDPLEFWVDVFVDYKGPRQIADESFLVARDHRLTGFNRQMYIEEVINNQSSLIRYRENPYGAPNIKVLVDASEFLDGATNGSEVTASTIVLGWQLYRDVEKVDVNILINGGYTDEAVQLEMADIAEYRMDSVAVLDMPSDSQAVSSAVSYRQNTLNLNTSYAAMYSPDIAWYDQYNDRTLYLPPSGFVSAAYALTDSDYATWFAPAGMFRGDVKARGVRVIYNQGDRDALVDAQINPMRVIPGEGYKIWGADTMQAMASALSNVNVRRLMNFLEKSIARAGLYSVFAPNDEILWGQLVEMCERFLTPILHNRGLYGFFVQCNDKNNTPEVIAAGNCILDVYVDPVIPAKRIHLNAIITRTGTTFKYSATPTSQF